MLNLFTLYFILFLKEPPFAVFFTGTSRMPLSQFRFLSQSHCFFSLKKINRRMFRKEAHCIFLLLLSQAVGAASQVNRRSAQEKTIQSKWLFRNGLFFVGLIRHKNPPKSEINKFGWRSGKHPIARVFLLFSANPPWSFSHSFCFSIER